MRPLVIDVWNVVETLWESLLGVWRASTGPVRIADDWLSAVVTVDGHWRGAVSFSSSFRTAQHVSRTMLDGGRPALDGDLVGEAHVGWPGDVAHVGIWHTASRSLHPSTTTPSN